MFTNTPSATTVNTDPGQPTAVVSWTEPTVTDNSGSYTLSSTHSPGSTFDTGNTTVTYTVVDESANDVTFSFDITVTGMILSHVTCYVTFSDINFEVHEWLNKLYFCENKLNICDP